MVAVPVRFGRPAGDADHISAATRLEALGLVREGRLYDLGRLGRIQPGYVPPTVSAFEMWESLELGFNGLTSLFVAPSSDLSRPHHERGPGPRAGFDATSTGRSAMLVGRCPSRT